MVKKLLNGMLFGTGAGIMLSLFMVGIFLVKGAWQSSNPTAGLGDATNLYTSGEDTLTREKWNALVEKVNTNMSSNQGWEQVDGNDVTSDFDPTCQRRWLYNTPANTFVGTSAYSYRYASDVDFKGKYLAYRSSTNRFTVSNTVKNKMTYSGGGRRYISKLEKKCN